MANLLGEPFREYVDDQIRVRQKVHGKKNRTTQELQYLNTRNAWIKMASAVSIDEDRLDLLRNLTEFDKNGKPIIRSRNNELLNGIYEGKNLALKNVLFGGLSSFGKVLKTRDDEYKIETRSGIQGTPYSRAYGVGGTNQFGYSPMPGITDMSFKCLNRGSIKKMSLNIKCHNRSQFDVIDVLYLRLGYSVFVEWGYDKYLDNGGNLQNMGPSLIDKEFWLDKYDKSDYSQWLPEIENQRQLCSGNYDGAFGVISNFSWTFEEDGTYDIKLEITSLGDIIESLKVNLPSVYLSKGSAFYARKFARMVEGLDSGGDGTIDQDTFYGTLYPGLDTALDNWFDKQISDGGAGSYQSYLPIQNLPLKTYEDYIQQTNLKFTDYYNVLKGKLGTDQVFLDEKGNEWSNKEIVDLTGDETYNINQQEIRDAIEYAVAQWFSDKWECPVEGPTNFQGNFKILPSKSRAIKPTANLGYVENYNVANRGDFYKSIVPVLFFEKGKPTAVLCQWRNQYYNMLDSSKQGINAEKLDGQNIIALADYTIRAIQNAEPTFGIRRSFNLALKNQSISTNDMWMTTLRKEIKGEYIIGAKTYQQNGVVNTYSDNSGNAALSDVIGQRGSAFKESDYKGKTFTTPGIDKKNLKTYVFQFFAQENTSGIGILKNVLAPVDKENSQIEDLQDQQKTLQNAGSDLSKDKQAELNKALSARSQKIEDYKNQNKNRIYRFFYDIREAIKNPSSSEKKVFKVGNFSLPGGTQLGKIYNYIEDPSFYKNLLAYTELAGSIKELEGYIKTNGRPLQSNTNIQQTSYKYTFSSDGQNLANKVIIKKTKNLKTEQEKLLKITSKYDFSLEDAQKAKNILLLDRLSPIENQGFVRLGYFLQFLSNNIIPKIKSSNNNQPLLSIDTNPRTNICYVIDNVVSLDIRKIIINNDYFINGLTDPNNDTSANIIPLFSNIDKYVTSINGNQVKYGQLMNIYFSFDRLQEIFDTTVDKNDVYLFNALKDICSDINECLGNINNIEPIVDENNIIHFIDQTSIPGAEEIAKALNLPNFDFKEKEKLVIFGYEGRKSNFVRKIGLTTEISKNYATMITIGATSNGAIPGVEATAFSRWNTGITDRFKNNITDANQGDEESLEPIETNPGKEVQNTYATLLKETVGGGKGFGLFGLSNQNNEYQINTNDIEYNAGIIEDFYKLMQAQNSYKDEKDKTGNTIESSVGFLPFNLKLDLDGISGIKIYNKMEIQQRFLPSNYPESLEFIITQVNHKLSNNDWVTSIETIATSKSVLTDKKKKPKPSK